MRTILITGAQGMLGQDLAKVFAQEAVHALDRAELDITDVAAIERVIDELRPDVIINAAAYNLVDAVESPEGRAIAEQVNVQGPGNLARACAEHHVLFVHFSTDYVFFGDSMRPYTESDEPRPCSAYGQTKLAGERAVIDSGAEHIIIRTCRLFGQPGIGEVTKQSFVDVMLKLAQEKKEIRVVNAEVASPTYTVDLAQKTKELVDATAARGIYHVTNSGGCTWYEFAQEIFRQTQTHVNVIPVSSAEFPRPAARPAYSVLATTRTSPLRSWQEALAAYLCTRR